MGDRYVKDIGHVVGFTNTLTPSGLEIVVACGRDSVKWEESEDFGMLSCSDPICKNIVTSVCTRGLVYSE